MSYDICYDRCFLRSEMGITPMWLVGSSNCTESVYGVDGKWHERLERHWSPLCNLAGVSEKELMERAYSYVPSHYNQHFMRGGKWVDDAGWIRFVENGIKKAVTVEQLLKFSRRSQMYCKMHVWVKDDSHFELQTWVSTTAEFDDWLRQAKEFKASRNDEWGPWFCIDMGMNEPLHIGNSDPKLPGRVAVKYKGNYVVGVGVHGISYARRVDDALIFDSLEAAKEACEGHGLQLQYVDGDAVAARKEWDWFIRVSAGVHEGRYVGKRTASKIMMEYDTKYAKRFPTKAAAEKYIAELRPRYKAEFEAVKG